MAMSKISRSLPLGEALFHVNVPSRDEATVAVAQVRDALDSIYLSSQSMRARVTSNNHVNDRAVVAYRLLTERTEAQEVVAEVASDCNVFAAIWGKLQEIPAFRNLVETVKRFKQEATSCLLPGGGVDLTVEDELSSFADHTSWWVSMFEMVVELVTDMWNGLVNMFVSAIPRIQVAFAREGDAEGDSHALETAMVITGLVVLVTAVIIAGTVLVL